jgi:hypothetical protein
MRPSAPFLREALRAVAAFAFLVVAGAAQADPVFGPTVYTKTAAAGADLYTDPIAAASGGRHYLWVQNGDDDGGRTSSGTVSVNGVLVLGDAQLQGPRELFVRATVLQAGSNSITVTLNGEPGSFLTVLILPAGERPFLTVGRLLLPYASASPNLQVELKNGSHGRARSVRVHFYDPAGALVGTSGRLVLEPKASLSQAVADLVAQGAFTEGSIEVFYAGHGRGRLFGQTATTNAATGIASIVPMQHAGVRVRDPFGRLNE